MNEYNKQLDLIETLKEREKILNSGEQRMIQLCSKNIDHKRAFLGTLMTISTGIITGLFILAKNESSLLIIISGFGLIVFVVFCALYLLILLSQESLQLGEKLDFIKKSKKDFIQSVGTRIVDIDTYKEYRNEQYEKELKINREIKGSRERWFIFICSQFIVSLIALLPFFFNYLQIEKRYIDTVILISIGATGVLLGLYFWRRSPVKKNC